MSSSPGRRATRLLIFLRRSAVLAAMVMAFFPVFWLLSTSFKPYEEWASSPPHWLPAKPTLQNYRIVFAPEAARRFAAKQSGSLDYKVSGSAWAAFGTSALVSTVATFLSVLAGTLAAYSICRFRTGGRTFAFQFLCARMFPPIAVVVPMVVLFLDASAHRHPSWPDFGLHSVYASLQHLDDPKLHRRDPCGPGRSRSSPRHGPIRSVHQSNAPAHSRRTAGDSPLCFHPQLVGVPVCSDSDIRSRRHRDSPSGELRICQFGQALWRPSGDGHYLHDSR